MQRTRHTLLLLALGHSLIGVGCANTPVPSDAPTASADGFHAGEGEMGRMVGMTEAHNRVRRAQDAEPPIPELVWDTALATAAQAHSELQASNGCALAHSSGPYGESLYLALRGVAPTADDVVARWYDLGACYTLGPFMTGDACEASCLTAMNAGGCGDYTQVMWRNSRRVGCGRAVCPSGTEIWTCNYDPPGNFIGQVPF